MNASVLIAKRVFDAEIAALGLVRDALDGVFDAALFEILNCKGKTVVTGMGKSGHVARKIAATLASLGSCAIFLHPGECLHGDLGMIQSQDVVVAISYSGESEEVIGIIPGIKNIGAKIIGITGNENSSLARAAALTQVLPAFPEACHIGLAPTSSTTAALVYGDALAVAASELKGFGKTDFKKFHPSGALGKSLILRVVDCMVRMRGNIRLTQESTLSCAFEALCALRWEILPVLSPDGALVGEVGVEKIKNALAQGCDVYGQTIKDYIVFNPIFVNAEEMAIDSLRMMARNNREAVIAVRDGKPVGLLRRGDMTKVGLSV